MAAVAEAVGGDVYVVGHSYGALAVLEAALITSAFRRIMLYQPPIPSPGHDVGSPEGLARITKLSDPREILQAFYGETLQLSRPAIKDLADREFPYLADSIGHTAGRELAAARAYRATERLAEITVPVRMLFGTQSPAYFRAAAAVVADWYRARRLHSCAARDTRRSTTTHNNSRGRYWISTRARLASVGDRDDGLAAATTRRIECRRSFGQCAYRFDDWAQSAVANPAFQHGKGLPVGFDDKKTARPCSG